MLSQFFSPITGGQERVVEGLSLALAARGHRVAVATTKQSETSDRETRDGIHIYRLAGTLPRASSLFLEADRRHLPPAPDPELVLNLGRLIKQERPDVIHAHDWMVHSLLPLRLRQVPVALTLHDYGLTCANRRLMRDGMRCTDPRLRNCVSCAAKYYGAVKGIPIALALRTLLPSLTNAVDCFLPVSNSVAAESQLQSRGVHFEVMPNFIAQGVLSSARSGNVGERPEWLPSGEFIMFAGDATYDKGIDVLLSAHAELGTQVPLVVVGRPFSARLQSAPNVYVVGPRSHDEVLAAWAKATVAVIPSLWAEPFGLVALEAMAFGRPVVASAVGGLVDIVEDGVTGILTPPGDAAALAHAIDRLLADPALRSTMGAAGRVRASSFDEAATVSRLESIYREMQLRAKR